MSGGGAGRELAQELRAELAAVAPLRACCRIAEAAGLGDGTAWGVGTRPCGQRTRLARLGRRLARGGNEAAGGWEWDAAADHCRIAYLRGLFLRHGSLSLSEGRAHLEFVVPPADGPALDARLRGLGLPASLRARRGKAVLTWKSTETVATFARLAGASSTVLDLEALRVARVLRGELNRVINAEAANLARTVDSAARQIEAIERLREDGRLGALPTDARAVAEARREAPEANLADLAAATGLHRSRVQRELQRIERLAAPI